MKTLKVLFCVTLLAAPVSAAHPLWNDARISKGLFDLAVADHKTPDGLCALGKREINNGSVIGKLLKG